MSFNDAVSTIIKFYGTCTYDLQRRELGNARSQTVKSF